ncbi:MAG: A24 family peptidase [Actinomycetia bacterium]|nr:A24 family peptidase [Actinomycetes bacterium]
MWVSVLLSVVVGAIAGRSIAAEVSAHRKQRPDRWWDPECDVCDGSLTATMIRCTPEGHPQRVMTPLLTVISGITFGAVASAVPSLWVLPAYLVFAAAMVTLTVTDLDTKLIPNRILGPATAISGTALIVGGLIDADISAVVRGAAGGLIYFGGMFLLALIARGGLGFGDVKLAFLIGVFAGYIGWGPLVVAAVGGFLIGGLVAIVLLVTRLSRRKDSIPFGPFMTLAGIIAVVFGDDITRWYLR